LIGEVSLGEDENTMRVSNGAVGVDVVIVDIGIDADIGASSWESNFDGSNITNRITGIGTLIGSVCKIVDKKNLTGKSGTTLINCSWLMLDGSGRGLDFDFLIIGNSIDQVIVLRRDADFVDSISRTGSESGFCLGVILAQAN